MSIHMLFVSILWNHYEYFNRNCLAEPYVLNCEYIHIYLCIRIKSLILWYLLWWLWERLNWEEIIIFHHVVRPPLMHDGWLYIVPPVSMRDWPTSSMRAYDTPHVQWGEKAHGLGRVLWGFWPVLITWPVSFWVTSNMDVLSPWV